MYEYCTDSMDIVPVPRCFSAKNHGHLRTNSARSSTMSCDPHRCRSLVEKPWDDEGEGEAVFIHGTIA